MARCMFTAVSHYSFCTKYSARRSNQAADKTKKERQEAKQECVITATVTHPYPNLLSCMASNVTPFAESSFAFSRTCLISYDILIGKQQVHRDPLEPHSWERLKGPIVLQTCQYHLTVALFGIAAISSGCRRSQSVSLLALKVKPVQSRVELV